MTQATQLSQNISGTEYAAQYDAAAKRLVSNKQVLARIIKGTIDEFKEYTIDEIISCIEEKVQVAEKSVFPHADKTEMASESISGMNTESTIPGEGTVTYDIFFYVLTRLNERIKILINIELQKKYHLGYKFGPRSIFYCARMISDQLGTEFKAKDYGNIKKVYSIWICMNAPEKYANTITRCSMKQEDIYGSFPEDEGCDLLSVVIIRMSEKEEHQCDNELIRMLDILLSDKMDAETKKYKLSNDFGMIMTEEIQGGVSEMCNLGEGLAEKYAERGMAQGMARGMAQATEEAISKLIETLQELGVDKDIATSKLMEKYDLDEAESKEKIEENWK